MDFPSTLPAPLMGRRHTLDPRHTTTTMESGRQRIRRAETESVELIDVSWNFTYDDYEVFREFYLDTLEKGTLAFVLETPKSNGGTIRRSCLFFGETYTFTRTDNNYQVEATLEVDWEGAAPDTGDESGSGSSIGGSAGSGSWTSDSFAEPSGGGDSSGGSSGSGDPSGSSGGESSSLTGPVMEVTPSGDWSFSLPRGEDGTGTIVYTVRNIGTEALYYEVTHNESVYWLGFWPNQGWLQPGEYAEVAVATNDNKWYLDPGTYYDTLAFTNTTNGVGNETVNVTMEITEA